jgi:hypothetical protein
MTNRKLFCGVWSILLFAMASFIPSRAFTQTKTEVLPALSFSGINIDHSANLTFEQVLSAPVLSCSTPYKVQNFDIAFYDNTNDEYYGPYHANVSKIRSEGIEALQKLKDRKAGPLTVFIDDIKVIDKDLLIRSFGGCSFTINN